MPSSGSRSELGPPDFLQLRMIPTRRAHFQRKSGWCTRCRALLCLPKSESGMCLHAKCLVKFSLCRSSATARSEEVVTIMRGYFWKFNTGVELSSESLGKLANWRRRQVDWAWACRQPCVFRRIFCLQRKSARTASGSVSPRVSDHKVLRNLSASEVITYLSEHLGRFSFQKDPLDSAGVSSKEREWRPAAGVRSPGCAFSHLSMAARMENYVSGSSLRCVNWCNALPACEAKAANLQSVEAARSGAGSAGVEQRSSPAAEALSKLCRHGGFPRQAPRNSTTPCGSMTSLLLESR